MLKPQISHEVPISLLWKSRTFNDYDYCLPHLLDQDDEYRDYFLSSSLDERYIIMDNSLHELGTPYSADRLEYWIKRLSPNEFIVPDHWQDKNKTLNSAEEWIQKEDEFFGVKLVAVVQANNLDEGLECFNTLKNSLGYKKIAISYGADWYKTLSQHPDENMAKMQGRINFVHALIKEFNLEEDYTDTKLHLLGCQLPQEFGYYTRVNCIETIDTSNPILAAIDNMKYDIYGLTTKPKTRIDDVIGVPFPNLNLDLIEYNINLFRKINNI